MKVKELDLALRSYLCDVIVERGMFGVLAEFIRLGVDCKECKKERVSIYGVKAEVLAEEEVERIINEKSKEELNNLVTEIMEVNKIPFLMKVKNGGSD